MKRILRKLIPLVLLGTLGGIAWQIQAKIQEKAQIEAARQYLPAFEFSTLAGEYYSSSQLPQDTPIVIMFVHPECPHCQYEAQALYQERDLHPHIQWVLVSEATQEQLEYLSITYHLQELPNVRILQAELGSFFHYFGSEALPSTFIYDSQQQLAKYYQGEVKISAILKHLKES